MTWIKTREMWIVAVPKTRREYVCVWQEEQGDRIWYDQQLLGLGYQTQWQGDSEQAHEMQAVMGRHGYRRILAMRDLTAHDLIRMRSLPNPTGRPPPSTRP